MASLNITPENFDYNKLSGDQKDLYDEFKAGLIEMMVKRNMKTEDLTEEQITRGFLLQNPDINYPAVEPEKIDVDALISSFTPSAKDQKPAKPKEKPVTEKGDGGKTDTKSDDGKNRQPTEEEKKRQADLEATMKQPEDVINQLAEESEAAKKKAAEEAKAKAKADAEAALRDLAAKLIDNPMSKVKIGEIEEFKDGKDKGFKAAVAKLQLAQKKDMSGLCKVLRAQKAGEINCDLIHWDSPDGELILSICWYVCVNGPVGVGKTTRFGAIPGTCCIKDIFFEAGYPEPVTNSMWKKFCKKMVDYIDIQATEVKTGKMMQLYGKLWPICDPDLISQAEYKAKRKDKYLEDHAEVFENAM